MGKYIFFSKDHPDHPDNRGKPQPPARPPQKSRPKWVAPEPTVDIPEVETALSDPPLCTCFLPTTGRTWFPKSNFHQSMWTGAEHSPIPRNSR